MANRYFIGTGNRNISDTANWSATSGGSGGASIPTSADNAIFDANSGSGTITINANFACADLTVSNLSGAMTISGSVYTFSVYGNLTLPATNLTISLTGTSYFYLKATTSVNITMGATTGRSFNRLYFDGVGGEWTNQDEMNVGNTEIHLLSGTWNTNNTTISCGNITGNSTATRIWNIGSSIINCNLEIISFYDTRLTINAGTSTINSSGLEFYSKHTFYNINLTYAGTVIWYNYGNYSFNNVTRTSVASVSASLYVSGQGFTILGTLTLTGNNNTNCRLLLSSSIIGTPRTITCNGSIVASNVDFRDITLAGTANRDLSAIAGGSGDCGGNSGITFTPAQPQYYKHTSGACNWSDSTKWFSDQAKNIQGRVPLPQDDATFDATSFTGASTLTVNCPRIGRSLNMEGVNQAVTMSLVNSIECYGSYVLGNNITPSGNYQVSLMGRSSFNFNPYSKMLYGLIINAYSGTYTCLANFTLTFNDSGCFTLSIGTFILNGYTYTGLGLSALSGTTLNLDNGYYYCNKNVDTSTLISILAGTTLSATNSLLVFNPVSGSGTLNLTLGGKTYNKIQFSGSHTGNFDITGNNTFAELIIDAGRKVRFIGGSTQTINKLTNNGAAGNLTTIGSTSTTKANIVLPTVQNIDYANISYINVTQPNKLFAGLNSVDGTNNVNVVFGAVASVINDVAFTEVEVLESNPLTLAKFSTAFTEKESLAATMLTKAFASGDFTEIESIQVTPTVQAVISANFAEKEQAAATILAKAFISAGFTEEEAIDIIIEGRNWFEPITGTTKFTLRITGNTGFTQRITGITKFK